MRRLAPVLFALACSIASDSFAQPVDGFVLVRDQNPFVLGSGLPLPPSVPASHGWQADATFAIANTELAQTAGDASLLFDAETRETRVSLAYAFDSRWSLRVSAGHLLIGAGFLDGAIEDFHHTFGFDNGDRGRLGTTAPRIDIERGGVMLYSLDHRRSGTGPTLLDLTRSWRGGTSTFGATVGLKLATGSESALTDTGTTDVSLGVFAEHAWGEHVTVAARGGVLRRGSGGLLAGNARRFVPHAGARLDWRLGERWTALVQADAHGALYDDLPDFMSAANSLTFGLARTFGDRQAVFLTLTEDAPALHTTDIVLQLGWRLRAGRN